MAEDFDLSLLGITDEDLDALLRDPDQVEGEAVECEDYIPEAPVTPVSVAGDLWQLGSHRLICGDSTSADVVGRLLGDVKPLLMVTDPPYGVEYDPSWRNQAGAAKTTRPWRLQLSGSPPPHPRNARSASSAAPRIASPNSGPGDLSATRRWWTCACQTWQNRDPVI